MKHLYQNPRAQFLKQWKTALKKPVECQREFKPIMTSLLSPMLQKTISNGIDAICIFVVAMDLNLHVPCQDIHDQKVKLKIHSNIWKNISLKAISPATIIKAIKECSKAVKEPVNSIKEKLVSSDELNLDESMLRCAKENHWIQTVSTPEFTYYKFHRKRGKEAMDTAGILPYFKGRAINEQVQETFSKNDHTIFNIQFYARQPCQVFCCILLLIFVLLKN